MRIRWLVLGLMLTATGCSKSDTERLGKVGNRVAQRAESLLPGGRGPLTQAWQAIPLPSGEVTLDARVSSRLLWDKSLADARIEVRLAPGGGVELRGTVKDLDQRRRAVALAEGTVGVEKVEDHLESSDKKPE
jgi:hypothetical protein